MRKFKRRILCFLLLITAILICFSMLLIGCSFFAWDWDEIQDPDPFASFSTFAQVMAGTNFTAGVRTDGSVIIWGANEYKQLCNGTMEDSIIPVEIFECNQTMKIGIGHSSTHVIALMSDGGLLAWGNNFDDQLGLGEELSRIDQGIPRQVNDQNEVLGQVIAVACGRYHSLALNKNGNVLSWGENGYGQLGLGKYISTHQKVPVQVSGLSNIKVIACGFNFSAALDSNGSLWFWGTNDGGQLGIPLNTGYTGMPTELIALSNVVAMACGDFHTVAIVEQEGVGVVYTWGNNFYNQLGRNIEGENTPTPLIGGESTNTPGKVKGINGSVIKVCAGNRHTLALTDSGDVYGWGNNTDDRLGIAGAGIYPTPTLIPISDVIDICAGARHSAAVKTDGTVWTWGFNNHSQLGRDSVDTIGQVPDLDLNGAE